MDGEAWDMGHKEYGGAAMEYILVSTFAALVTIASLAFIGKTVKQHLSKLAQTMGSEDAPDFELPFGD